MPKALSTEPAAPSSTPATASKSGPSMVSASPSAHLPELALSQLTSHAIACDGPLRKSPHTTPDDHGRSAPSSPRSIKPSMPACGCRGRPAMPEVSIFETNPLRQRGLQERESYRQAKPNGLDQQTILALLSGSAWLTRDIPKPDFLLGELLSTTCRVEVVGPTGLGKTNILLAITFAIADGADFQHWKGSGKPRRVLFIDGEMSRRLAKERLEDAARRHGGMPGALFYFNREDFPNFEPLNTEAGQKYIDYLIEQLSGIDLAIFDNIQALIGGDMKDEEPWQDTLPWVRDLTRRSIGQIWAHHTGHDETRAYGTKTREWQLDTVVLLERVEQPSADIAFQMKFTKARERRPDNRADFEPAVITLVDDRWT